MTLPEKCDVAILGGGLSGALIAMALAARRPDLSLLLIEQGGALGGNHTWSFFEQDLDPRHRWLAQPLICHSWSGHDVAFPRHRRTLSAAYHTVSSDHLDREVRKVLPSASILTGRRVHTAGPTLALLDDGTRIEAGGIIDARGPGDLGTLDLGWQKFLGHEVRLAKPHGLERPMIMDATVAQIDGYRFVYLLPFAKDRLLIEDTYYSDAPKLSSRLIRPRIERYAAANGWRIAEVLREESGVLPVAMGGDFEAYWRSGGDGIAKAGVRAGNFHPLTGYSFADAVRTAAEIAAMEDLSGEALHDSLYRAARRNWTQRRYYRMLTRMLFRAAEPSRRWMILDQFYRRNERLIGRFYGARSTFIDKLTMLAGRPPVSVGKALRAIAGGQK